MGNIKKYMKKGFTLIELLVVIVIIGIIAALTTIALGSVRAKARDTKRIADIRNLQSALEIYKNDNGVYPTYATSGTALVANGQTYMAKIPTAPTNTGTDVYTYTSTSPYSSYQIAYNLEKGVQDTSSGNLLASPGQIGSSAPIPPPAPVTIGQAYQGGIVAYILIPGDPGYSASVQHGIIAATSDQGAGIAWIIGGSTQSTANTHTLTTLGSGQANTTFMMQQTGFTGGAAKVCDDYVVGVYDDWYLPSKEEINKLYLSRNSIGGFTQNYYWSSSESNASFAYWQQTSEDYQSSSPKPNTYYVRPIRSF